MRRSRKSFHRATGDKGSNPFSSAIEVYILLSKVAKGFFMNKGLENTLDERVKKIWRIKHALLACLTWIFIGFLAAIALLTSNQPSFLHLLVSALVVICFIANLVIAVFIWPNIMYRNWTYEMSREYLEISHGVFFKKHTVVPFIRVQNTDTLQGPLLRAFKLAEVVVSSAASSHKITGLDMTVAEALRDKAAEFARLAKEDV